MKKTTDINIAKILYDSYPGSKFLFVQDPSEHNDIKTFKNEVNNHNIGDGLFKFIVVETFEVMDDKTKPTAKDVIEASIAIDRAIDQLQEVSQALYSLHKEMQK